MTCTRTLRFVYQSLQFFAETHLDERLNLAPLGQFLRPHSFCHLQRVSLDTSNNGMREGSLFGPFVVLFDDDNLFAGLTPLEDNSDLRDTVQVKALIASAI